MNLVSLIRLVPGPVRNRLRGVLPNSSKAGIQRLVARGLSEGEVFTVSDGRRFVVSQDRVFARVVVEGDYEPEYTAIARNLVMPGDWVVDVGANFGWYATLFGDCVGPGGRVFAFEPNAEVAARLRRNVELNNFDNIEVHEAGVAAATGTADMQFDSDKETALGFVKPSDSGSGAVRLVTLADSLPAEAAGRVPFVKIDVEGYEVKVLQGAAELLGSNDPPILHLEANQSALTRAGDSLEALREELAAAGYVRFFYPAAVEGRLQEKQELLANADVYAVSGGKYADRLMGLVD